MKTSIAVLIGLLLAGCANKGALDSLGPVCEALGPHYDYTSNPAKKDSPIHAGPVLAQRLSKQNAIGENLPCPGY